MNNFLRRRNILTEHWDYVWHYTMGLPEDNGCIKGTSGSNLNVTMENDGLKIYTGDSGTNYVTYNLPITTTTAGILEAQFIGNFNASTNHENFRCVISNGSTGCNVITPKNLVAVYDASSVSNCTTLVSVSANNLHTIRCVLKGTVYDVYVDGVQQLYNQPCAPMQYTTANRVWVQNTGTSYWCKLISFRYKNLRPSSISSIANKTYTKWGLTGCSVSGKKLVFNPTAQSWNFRADVQNRVYTWGYIKDKKVTIEFDYVVSGCVNNGYLNFTPATFTGSTGTTRQAYMGVSLTGCRVGNGTGHIKVSYDKIIFDYGNAVDDSQYFGGDFWAYTGANSHVEVSNVAYYFED